MSGVRFWLVTVLLLGATIGLQLLRHGEAVPLRDSLDTMPFQIAGWQGHDDPLEKRIVEATGADEYLNRVYVAEGRPVFLYIGYYRNQRTGETIHSPKNCLPGGGWQPLSAGRVELQTPDGHKVTVNQYLIAKGLERQLVLYWYQSHGRIIASEYWAKIYMVTDALRLNRTDAALVRVAMPLAHGDQGTNRKAVQFAEQLLPQLDRIIPR
ncbi:MAG: exosortase C-terminal domain/associated protein EpsI [Terriglobales bacterium]